jgi:hypothetical protein
MSKYISEAVSAISEAKLKMGDVSTTVQVIINRPSSLASPFSTLS